MGGAAAEIDWLGICRRIVAGQRELFAAETGIAARTSYEGIGSGGDRALVLDRRCEDLAFAELERLAAEGVPLLAISEERGEVRLGNGEPVATVVLDPIDGSLNARRTIPSHSFSFAVASGSTMGDVDFGLVYDFGSGEEFVGNRGAGALLAGEPLRARGPGYGLEVVGVESANPRWMLPAIEVLAGHAYRLRAVGSIAISLSYVAAGRFDAMLTMRPCRSVDAAAAQLIAREAGAEVEFVGHRAGDAGLDLGTRYQLAGALDAELLASVREAQDAAIAAA